MEGALIAAFSALITLLVKAFLDEKYKRNQKAWEIDLLRCDEQIGKLYAPLENLVEQLDATDDVKKLMTKADDPHAREISKFCYDHYFVPIHTEIAILLSSQLHLLEDDGIPISFIEYYKHVASEKVFFSLSTNLEQAETQGMVPERAKYLTFVPHPYPESEKLSEPNFKRTIKDGAAKVQKRQEELLQRFRNPQPFWRTLFSN